jgi:hypothetical protein
MDCGCEAPASYCIRSQVSLSVRWAPIFDEATVRRTPIRDVVRAVVFLGLLGVLLAAVLAYLYRSARTPGFLSPGVPECRAAYHRAQTAGDSAMVDVQHPSSGPQKDPNAPTCGTLRITGRLR